MVDVRQMLGDAPQEQVTTGTAGRVSEETNIFGTIAQGASNLFSAMGERDRRQAQSASDADKAAKAAAENAAAEAQIGILAEAAGFGPTPLSGSPELAERDEKAMAASAAAADIERQAQRQAESGRLSPDQIARRKLQKTIELTKMFPGYQAEILKSMGGGSIGGLQDEIEEVAKYDRDLARKQEEARVSAINDAYKSYGGDPSASIEEKQAYVSRLAPMAMRIQRLTVETQQMQAEGTYSKAVEKKNLIDNAIDINTSAIGPLQRAWKSETDPVKRAENVRTAIAQVKFSLLRSFPNMATDPTEMDKYLPGFTAYSDNLLKMADARTPAEEVKRLEAMNDVLLAQSTAALFKSDPALVRVTAAAKISEPLLRSADELTKQRILSGAIPALNRLSSAMQGTVDNQPASLPTNLITGDLSPSDKTNREAVAKKTTSMFGSILEWGKMLLPGDTENARVYSTAIASALNDDSYQYTNQVTVSMLPMLADPKTAELVATGKTELTEVGGKRLNDLMESMTRQVEIDLNGKVGDKLTFKVDEKTGFVTVAPKPVEKRIPGTPKGMVFNQVLPQTAKKYETKLNQTIRARAHLEGSTDYLKAAKSLFGSN